MSKKSSKAVKDASKLRDLEKAEAVADKALAKAQVAYAKAHARADAQRAKMQVSPKISEEPLFGGTAA